MNDTDRISLLPDSLLHHIFSFLNIKSVIQACVLSKRWKTLWTDIPTLNFDFDSYPFEGSTGDGFYSKYSSIKRFIFRVFSEHRCKPIKKLSYSSSTHTDEAALVVELLICYERHNQVQELCIDTFNTVFFDCPLDLFKCFSLTVLKMTSAFVYEWEDLYLPRLRILEIRYEWEDWVYVGKGEDSRDFSGFPDLESLVLVNCLCDIASITAPKLENFEFSATSKWMLTFPQVELLAPNLKSVKFSNVLPIVKSDSEFSCINKVNIALYDYEFDGDGSATQKLIEELSQLLQVFHNARSFTLPMKAMKVLLSIPPPLSGFSFHNLRHLKLKTEATNNTINLPISALMSSLKCPNLEMLGIDLNQVELAMGLAALQEKYKQRELKLIEEMNQTKAELEIVKASEHKTREELARVEANVSQTRTELAELMEIVKQFMHSQAGTSK